MCYKCAQYRDRLHIIPDNDERRYARIHRTLTTHLATYEHEFLEYDARWAARCKELDIR